MTRHPLFCLTLLILVAMVAPYLARRQAENDLENCENQLSEFRTAVEMYSTDSSGRFPLDPALVTPNYLKTIPTCPTDHLYVYASRSVPDEYTIHCSEPSHPLKVNAGQCTLGRP